MRLIVLNRRDFPGSAPYSDDEHAQLNKALQGPPEETKKLYVPFMKERSKEFVEFLGALIEKEKIPCVDETGRGGIVLTSWSMGAFWLVPFLKDVASISEAAGVELQKYISRAVLYGELSSLVRPDILLMILTAPRCSRSQPRYC